MGAAPAADRQLHPLVAAFNIGMCLNALDWYLLQAFVCCRRFHGKEAEKILGELELLFLELFPQDRGAGPRRLTRKFKREWQAWFGGEQFYENWLNTISPSFDFGERRTVKTLVNDLAFRVPKYRKKIEQSLRKQLAKFPRMVLALQLGICIDEGLRPPAVKHHLLRKATSKEWRQWRRRSAAGTRSPEPRKHEFLSSPRKSGELAPAGTWPGELAILWRRAGLPEAALTDAGGAPATADGRIALDRRLVEAAHVDLSSSEEFDPETDATEMWPPDLDWHFREGEFAVGGKSYPVSPQELKFAQVLHESRRPLTSVELFASIWDDECEERKERLKKLRNLKVRFEKRVADPSGKPPNVQIMRPVSGSERLWTIKYVCIPGDRQTSV